MGKSKFANQRYVEADNTKGFLIFFVILGHVLQRKTGGSFFAPRVQLWIYLFHMPAFIFIAGMFAKKTIQKRRFEKVFAYLLLYAFMKVLFYATDVYIKGADNAAFLFFNEHDIPWFCFSMFWWHLIVILIQDRFPPRVVMTTAVLAALIVGYTSLDSSYLVLLRSINFFPFFYLGYLTDPDPFFSACRKRKVQLLGICVLSFSFWATVFTYSNENYIKLFRGRYLYKEIGHLFFGISGGCTRLIAFFISLVILFSLFAVCSIHATAFAFVGRYTLQIFVFHGPLISIVFSKTDFFRKTLFPGNTFVQAFVISLLILFITLLPPFYYVVQNVMAIPGIIADTLRRDNGSGSSASDRALPGKQG